MEIFMDLDIRSVTFEQKEPTFKDFLKAAFAYATFRPDTARAHLRGEQWLHGKNAAGELVCGISGGGSMTIFTGQDQESPAPENRPKGGLNL
jgi:hypothetical protein